MGTNSSKNTIPNLIANEYKLLSVGDHSDYFDMKYWIAYKNNDNPLIMKHCSGILMFYKTDLFNPNYLAFQTQTFNFLYPSDWLIPFDKLDNESDLKPTWV